jgi:hypothetical protein
METERVRTDLKSPRLERFRRQVLDLQDQYYSGQKQINQLTKELKLRTNKPEYQRCCQEIRKELCTRINEVAWKQKKYECENTRLQKMTDCRTFTKVERAFTATTVVRDTSVESKPNDISHSFDQGSGVKLPMKLSTKEKFRRMQAMLQQLEHDVQEDFDENSDQNNWDDSDDSTEKKSNGEEDDHDRKPVAINTTGQAQSLPCPGSGESSSTGGQNNVKTEVVITPAQAKLAKELIKLANTYKVPELTFSDQASKRHFGYQTWFNKLRLILVMFPETSEVIQGEKIVPLNDANCVCNKALYLVIGSRVDAYFQRAIRKLEGKGDQALLFIKNQCASTTADDTHHFHYLFTSIRIKEKESATNFFRRFTFACTEAEAVGNVYSDQSFVKFALARLGTSKNAKYDTAVQLYNLERDSGKLYSLDDVEKKYFALDKKSSREAAKLRLAQGHVAMGHRGDRNTHRSRNLRNPRRNGHRKTADANSALDSSNFNCHANTTCYYCDKKGHIVPNCPDKKNGKPRNNKPAQGNLARNTGAGEKDNSPE